MNNNTALKVLISLLLISLMLITLMYKYPASYDLLPIRPRYQPHNPDSRRTYQEVPVEKVKLENRTLTRQQYQLQLLLIEEEDMIKKACTFENWRDIFKPCESRYKWIQKERDEKKRTSIVLSQIELTLKPYGYPSILRIQTRDSIGRMKNYGGDSWNVCVYGENFSLCFHLHDRLDGSYEGVFVIKQVGKFSMTVTLEYSLCDGLRDPPLNFFNQGTIQARKQAESVIGNTRDFLHTNVKIPFTVQKEGEQPVVRNIASTSCRVTQNHCGYWKNSNFYTYDNDERKVKLPHFDKTNRPQHSDLQTLGFFGDSLSGLFFYSINKTGVCEHVFKSCRNFHHERIEVYYDGKDFNASRFLNVIKEAITSPTLLSNKSYFVMNFGLHHVMSVQMMVLLDLFRSLLKMLNDLKSVYGEVHFPKIIWKTTTAPRPEYWPKIIPYTHFFTSPRVYLWNSLTIPEACKANIPILDVYNMALSNRGGAKDQAHYQDYVFKTAEEELITFILRDENLE